MAKTHLEHQKRRFNVHSRGGNGTTTYSPYANYDPKEGLTTAIILGGSFIFLVTYILAKMGWEKFKKRYCCRRVKMQDNLQLNEMEQQVLMPHSQEQEQGIPVVVTPTHINGVNKPILTREHLPLTKQASDSTSPASRIILQRAKNTPSIETYTMIIPEMARSKSRSRSNSESPEKTLSLKLGTPQSLPPQVNQALRTAHWVNNVNSEMKSSFEMADAQSPRSVKHTIKAEINHNQSDHLDNGDEHENFHENNPSTRPDSYQLIATTEV